MTKIVVKAQRRYAHPPMVMWRVFADPEVSVTLDDRVTLIAINGAPGTVGSSYELAVKVGLMSVAQRVTVLDASVPDRLEAVTEVKGRAVAVQLAEFAGSDSGTEVSWTFTGSSAFPLSRLVRRKIRKELVTWLDTAEAAARAVG